MSTGLSSTGIMFWLTQNMNSLFVMRGQIGRLVADRSLLSRLENQRAILVIYQRPANFAPIATIRIPDEMSTTGRSFIGSSNRLVAVASIFVIIVQFGFYGGDMSIV